MVRKKNMKSVDADEMAYIDDYNKLDPIDEADIPRHSRGKETNYKVVLKCKNEKQKTFLNSLKNPFNEICFGTGSAGSGKSYISLGYALSALKDPENAYDRVIVIVPTCEAGNMSIGFLKGTLEEKLAPYLEADTYTMEKILSESGNLGAKGIVNDLIRKGRVEYQLVNFARGKTFDNCVVLINEAENYSKEEMLLLLTRVGKNCKLVVTGDPVQLDRKDIKRTKASCGLEYAIERLCPLDEVECTVFTDEDIVRNPLIGKILDNWFDNDRSEECGKSAPMPKHMEKGLLLEATA